MIKSIIRRLSGLIFRKEPRTLIFEVTDCCNLSCRYCYRPVELNKQQNHMDLATLEKIKKSLARSSQIFSVGISGGEPLMNPQIDQLIPHFLEIDPHANLLTNLSLINESRAARLKKAGLNSLQITVFSPMPDQHDNLRNCSDFARTMESIGCLKKLGFKIEAILLVTSVNYKMAIPAMEMIRSLGIDGFMINRFNAGFPENHKAAGDLFLEDKGFYDWLGDLENYGSANNFQIHFAIPIPPCALPRGKIFPHLAFSFCPIGREAEYLTVSPNGDLRPCNHLPVILGNLCDETIEEILQKEKYQKFLHELGDPPEFCRGCVAWKSCRGGCRGAAFSWSGTLKRHDPWLDKIRASKINATGGYRPEYEKKDQW